MIEPFLSAIPVLEMLEDEGFEAYFVGGSVRDYLLKKSISDVDIATSATPLEVKKIFPKTIDIGIEHGTILVLFKNQSYEITTFRVEAEYEDFRRPKKVSFIRNLIADLGRRDFTMNAIAMDRIGKLIDPYDGQKAINEKKIQTVGQAAERFQEDALRMMRAVRFMSQLSFKIEKDTVEALAYFAHLLGNIAIERKRAEFEKLLVGPNYKAAIQAMIETNLYSFLPGLSNQEVYLEKLLAFESSELNKQEKWALLVYCLALNGKSLDHFLRNWRLSVKEIRDIQHVIHYLNKRMEQEWSVYTIYLANRETVLSVEKLYFVINNLKEKETIYRWQEIYNHLPIKHRAEMNVSGNELMSWFNRVGGPWVKEVLDKIEQAIVEGKVENEKKHIKEWLMECNPK
jgi:tRNA nucleotidyltransferase (CCA-adding enzyme)